MTAPAPQTLKISKKANPADAKTFSFDQAAPQPKPGEPAPKKEFEHGEEVGTRVTPSYKSPLPRQAWTPATTVTAMNNRKAKYVERITAALPFIREARAAGLRNASQFAAYLSQNGVPAATGGTWTDDAVHRALKRLKALGLDQGSLHAVLARKKFPARIRTTAMKAALVEAKANGLLPK